MKEQKYAVGDKVKISEYGHAESKDLLKYNAFMFGEVATVLQCEYDLELQSY